MYMYCKAALRAHEVCMKAFPSPKPKGRAGGGVACVLRCHSQRVLQSKRHRVNNTVSRGPRGYTLDHHSTNSYRKMKGRAYKAGEQGGGTRCRRRELTKLGSKGESLGAEEGSLQSWGARGSH